MWVLGKVALLVVMALSGLLLLVSSLPWLSYLLHDAPLPTRRLGELAAATLGSAAILGSAIWLYWLLDRYRQRILEQRRQATPRRDWMPSSAMPYSRHAAAGSGRCCCSRYWQCSDSAPLLPQRTDAGTSPRSPWR